MRKFWTSMARLDALTSFLGSVAAFPLGCLHEIRRRYLWDFWKDSRVFEWTLIFLSNEARFCGATHFKFRRVSQWRCLTSVAPDAKSCLVLRTFWLFWLLWECFACSEWKNMVTMHFRKSGHFFWLKQFSCNFLTGRRWTGTVGQRRKNGMFTLKTKNWNKQGNSKQ